MSKWSLNNLRLVDAFRAGVEYRAFRREWHRHKDSLPAGDGHPVLVLPGFTNNDFLTSPLRTALAEKNYTVYGWENGFNLGIRAETAQHLARRLRYIYEENGRQPVSLIGHSLGGLYARELAKEYPKLVRNVVTIGAPFGIGIHDKAAPKALMKVIDIMTGKSFSIKNKGMAERLLTPPRNVPTTSIFSRTDGVVPWQACLNPQAELAENVEVDGSHTGGIWNLGVMTAVFDRLAQPRGSWQPHAAASAEAAPLNPGWSAKGRRGWRLFPSL